MRKIIQISLLFVITLTLWSCNDDPDAYVISKGKPEISYFRVTNKDSLITESYMGATVAIIGKNMRSVVKVLFNDQVASLNTSFITPTSMILSIPNTISNNVTNKAYFISQSGDTVKFDFKILIPPPIVNSMKCEFVPNNEIATIYGDYFVDDITVPLEVIFETNVQATEIISISKTEIKVKVPQGAQTGRVVVKSVFGEGTSKFIFRDSNGGNNLNLEDNGPNSKGPNITFKDIYGIYDNSSNSKSYYFYLNKANLTHNMKWYEAEPFLVEYAGGLLGNSSPDDMVLKFEVNVLTAWKVGFLQFVFTPSTIINKETLIAEYYSKSTYPRILWMPWKSTANGEYKTDGWITVSIPLKDAIYDPTGIKLTSTLPNNAFDRLTFFVWEGNNDNNPPSGTQGDINICIDNIRIVAN